jgi:ATP-binding cassette subfamily B protein
VKEKQQNPIKVLFSFAGEAKGKMTLSVILAVAGELFGTAPFFAVTVLAGQVYAGTATVRGAAMIAGAAAVCMALRSYLTMKSSLRSHGISFIILKNIRRAIADKMRRVPMGVMLETPSGTFKTLLVDNVGRLEDIIAHMVPELPSAVAAPVTSIILVFTLDWRMGLASLITVPVSLLFMVGMMRGYSEKMAVYLRSGNEMNASLVEYVGGIQVIKAFGQAGRSFGRFSESVRFFHDSTMSWWRQSWFWMAGFKAVLPSTLLGTLPIGALLYMNGGITLPLLLACIIIPVGFMPQLMRLGFGLEQLAYMAANLKPIREFLASAEQHRPEVPVTLAKRDFVFENVGFSYDGKTEVLHDVSFTAAPGSVTAIVGPSGSGKSTVAKLMAGFWDATSGTVRFGGHDLRDIPFAQLMGEVSYVAQDNFLFDKSIRENIRMGNPAATDAEVEAAARAANCHDFILELEQGYDTLAGDAGDRLSGGERQRITIARAMLKPASVVILDEATAYADPENEAQIQQAISRLVRGKTLIVVAHRLSTIRNANQILVIDGGRLAARGTHDELRAGCPLYETMWRQYISAADTAEETAEEEVVEYA